MIRLIGLFLWEYLKIWFYILAAGMALLFIGPKLGVDQEVLALPLVLFLGGGFVGAAFIQKNTSWIKSLPVSKLGIFLAALFSSLINLGLMGLVWFAYAAGLFLRNKSEVPHSFLEQAIQVFDFHGHLSSAESLMYLSILFGGFFFSTFNPFVNRFNSIRVQNIPLRFKFLYLVLFASAFYILTQVNSLYLSLSMILAGEWWFFYQALNRELALYPEVKRAIRYGITLLVLAQMSIVYGIANEDLKSSQVSRVIGAQKFLGVTALPIPEARLVQVFSKVQDPRVIQEIFDSYPRILNLVNVDVWLKSKPDPKLIIAIEKRLTPETFDKAKVLELLARYDELKLDPRPQFYMRLLHAQIKAEEVKEFITSPGRHSFVMGVLLCRKYVEQDCSGPLVERLKTMTDSDLFSIYTSAEILRTLSVLRASLLSFDFYADVKADKVSTKDWVEPQINCKEWATKDLSDVTSVEIAQLNFCIRTAALRTPKTSEWNKSVAFYSKEEIQRLAPSIRDLIGML